MHTLVVIHFVLQVAPNKHLGFLHDAFKQANELPFLVTWHDFCWITKRLIDRMSFRESEHSTLVVAWFVSELPGKSVLARHVR